MIDVIFMDTEETPGDDDDSTTSADASAIDPDAIAVSESSNRSRPVNGSSSSISQDTNEPYAVFKTQ